MASRCPMTVCYLSQAVAAVGCHTDLYQLLYFSSGVSGVVLALTLPFARGDAVRVRLSVEGSFALVVVLPVTLGRDAEQLYSTWRMAF